MSPATPMVNGEELFWELVEPLYADPAVQRSTMMGLPCVRLDGRFFASLDRRTDALLVKLPPDRVQRVISDGHGEPFAPAGRVFREWVAVPRPDRRRWRALLVEAQTHARGTDAADPDPPPRTTGFAGFGVAGLEFLAGLERDNSKRFFDTHRDIYRRDLLEPSKAFVIALGAVLRERISGQLNAEPRIGGSLFRIANDLRFAKDKPPYKAHLDFSFWQGPHGPRSDPSLLLRITSDEIHLGCGIFAVKGSTLDRYRNALRDPASLAGLDASVTALLGAGAELSEPSRARLPAGFDPASPAAQYAMRDGFQVIRRCRRPAPVTSARLVTWCADRLAPFGPVHAWLVDNVA
jgi:uncharacterized protein (TIGR02453 family)